MKLVERLGMLVDKADDCLTTTPGIPPRAEVRILRQGLEEIRDRMKNLYLELGGKDVWR